MQFDELGNMDCKTLMLLPGTCCDYQTNFATVLDALSEKYHLICVNYRDIYDDASRFHRLMIKFCDKLVKMVIIKIRFR